ncbi:MAG: hypothetical protein A2Y12_06785 [Planctomycetes bacterium GWF2_42_9]|nr:MAG: hypothetical protein A2Y12_06785 [Planctomycetes bacterium GWF2_42_9]
MKVGRRRLSHVSHWLPAILITFLTLCANATTIDFYTDGIIQSGDCYDQVNVWNTAAINMTGGIAQSVWTYDSSTFNVQNGSVSLVVSLQNTSIVTILGGEIASLQLLDNSIAYLYGGNITETLATAGMATVHIYGKNFNFIPKYSNGPGWITGNWSDGSFFSIYYRNYEPFPGTHLFLHEIPEPCTLGLVSLGFFTMRRNIKTFRK